MPVLPLFLPPLPLHPPQILPSPRPTSGPQALNTAAKPPLTDRSQLVLCPSPAPVHPSAIDTIRALYSHSNAAVNHGVCSHSLGRAATAVLNDARARVANILNVADPREIVFSNSTTSATYLVATSLCSTLRKGDEILLAINTPDNVARIWHHVAARNHITIRPVLADLSNGARFTFIDFASLISSRTRAVILPLFCPITGAQAELQELSQFFRSINIPVIVDAADALAVTRLDVRAIHTCDLLVANAQPAGAPTGAVLYGRLEILERLPPAEGGEHALSPGRGPLDISQAQDSWGAPPERFEAGQPPLAEAAGIAAALPTHMTSINDIQTANSKLVHTLVQALQHIDGLHSHIALPQDNDVRLPAVCFDLNGVSPSVVVEELASRGVLAIAGTHGARLAHARGLDVEETVRVEFCARHHTEKDVLRFAQELKATVRVLTQV